MGTTKRIEWLDTLRALGMWLVVVGHVAEGNTPDTFRFYIYSFHMPLFFIISGGAYYLQSRKGLKDFKTTLKSKAMGLLLPYFALNAIALLIWVLNYKILTHSKTNILVKIMAIIYGNGAVATGPSNATWFLPTLFLTVMAFYVLQLWSKGDERILTLSIISLGALSYTSSLVNDKFHTPWHFEIVPIALIMFLLGYLGIKYFESIEKILGGYWRQLGIFAFLLFAGYCCARFNVKISFQNHRYGSIFLLLGSTIGFSGALTLISMWLPKFKILQYIGKNTIVCLAFHSPILRFLQFISEFTNKICTDYPILTATAIFIITIPLTLLFDKCFPVLIGKRSKPKSAAL